MADCSPRTHVADILKTCKGERGDAVWFLAGCGQVRLWVDLEVEGFARTQSRPIEPPRSRRTCTNSCYDESTSRGRGSLRLEDRRSWQGPWLAELAKCRAGGLEARRCLAECAAALAWSLDASRGLFAAGSVGWKFPSVIQNVGLTPFVARVASGRRHLKDLSVGVIVWRHRGSVPPVRTKSSISCRTARVAKLRS